MDFIWWVEKFELPALGFLGVWNLRLQVLIDKAATMQYLETKEKEISHAIVKASDDFDIRMNLVSEDHTNFKLSATKEFATFERVEKIEDKIDRRLDSIEKKLDGILARRSHS